MKKPGKSAHFSEKAKRQIVARYRAGASIIGLSGQVGIGVETIRRWIAEAGARRVLWVGRECAACGVGVTVRRSAAMTHEYSACSLACREEYQGRVEVQRRAQWRGWAKAIVLTLWPEAPERIPVFSLRRGYWKPPVLSDLVVFWDWHEAELWWQSVRLGEPTEITPCWVGAEWVGAKKGAAGSDPGRVALRPFRFDEPGGEVHGTDSEAAGRRLP